MVRPRPCPNCKKGWVFDDKEVGFYHCNVCSYVEGIGVMSMIDKLKDEISQLESAKYLSNLGLGNLVRKRRELGILYQRLNSVSLGEKSA